MKKRTYKQWRKIIRLAAVVAVMIFPMYLGGQWRLWIFELILGDSDMAFAECIARVFLACIIYFGEGYSFRSCIAQKVFRTEEDEPMDRDLEWPEHLQSKPKKQKTGETLTRQRIEELLIPLTAIGFSCEYAHSYGEDTFTCSKEDTELQICTDYQTLYCMIKTKKQPLAELSRSKLLTPQQKNAYRKAKTEEKLSLLAEYFG